MSASFPTPRPAAYLGKPDIMSTAAGPLGIVHPMTSIVSAPESMPHVSLITPDCSPRDMNYTDVTPMDTAKKISLVLTKEVLSKGKKPATKQTPNLVPRPAKAGRSAGLPPSIPVIPRRSKSSSSQSNGARLNKFVRRLHDMLQAEKDSGIVEWRRGLLVLYSTDAFAKTILPKYFNTRNFKTFRRQLNYYGFVHVRSFSTTGSSTTALWVNRELAKEGNDDISSVLMLKRVEPCESAKTAEGRRYRKEMAIFTVEEDIGVSAKTLQLEQIRSMALRGEDEVLFGSSAALPSFQAQQSQPPPIPREVHVPTDVSSGSNYESSCSNEDSEDSNTMASSEEDMASASAANVLLMLARSSTGKC